jgi:hypothetical protein
MNLNNLLFQPFFLDENLHVQLELLPLHYGFIFYSIYSYSFGQPSPLHFLIKKKHSIPITSAAVSRSVHFSAPQCNLTMNHLFWMKICTLSLNYQVYVVLSICFLYLQVDPTRLVLYLWLTSGVLVRFKIISKYSVHTSKPS